MPGGSRQHERQCSCVQENELKVVGACYDYHDLIQVNTLITASMTLFWSPD